MAFLPEIVRLIDICFMDAGVMLEEGHAERHFSVAPQKRARGTKPNVLEELILLFRICVALDENEFATNEREVNFACNHETFFTKVMRSVSLY